MRIGGQIEWAGSALWLQLCERSRLVGGCDGCVGCCWLVGWSVGWLGWLARLVGQPRREE